MSLERDLTSLRPLKAIRHPLEVQVLIRNDVIPATLNLITRQLMLLSICVSAESNLYNVSSRCSRSLAQSNVPYWLNGPKSIQDHSITSFYFYL